FSNVTVFFSDIVGFTKMSAKLEPKFLIDELNEIFTAFDVIIEKNQCERIKTIGDAYLAVCGLPLENGDHAENIVKAAIEILAYIKKRNKEAPVEWNIRIGIHTGKVIGGVVGIKKYIYDVFGDTINTASRVETNSEPMKINLSEITYSLVKDKFSFVEREPIDVKGKGTLRMYFLDV
ncbi:adenylate/guanylate cyclase domain-containing protein, partial [candidate division CSSED10-310 bacterium]